jgi:uncharacterized membrane protein YdbT with pleckstrin-like domain
MSENVNEKVNENVSEEKFRPEWRSFYWHILALPVCFVVGIVFKETPEVGIVCLIAFIIVALHMIYKRLCLTLIVKPDEIALEKGFIKRHSIEISTKSIRSIEVNQSIMQRILNIGDIKVASAGTSGYEITAESMPNPYGIRDKIQVYERSCEKNEKNQD